MTYIYIVKPKSEFSDFLKTISWKLQYKDVYRRTIEMLQHPRTFQVNCCLNKTTKTTIANFGIRSKFYHQIIE